ncbi:hypothetical protein KUTeg_020006 [Tegillarca granosa]|uniref:FAD dependent oxidoreductase domain-containing protein n=1 Tax=Tegillarca granosa TaxID=220873 RepID=A0ABQ9EJA9_TEGGR|nr:hypothetical protein KUTeg_020006 [Tegillarca granosa]
MIGSAVARHASLHRSLKVCLIGPEEPKKRLILSGREVFGAHYDEGRITRQTDIDPVWAHLAHKSIENYKHLETESEKMFLDNKSLKSMFPYFDFSKDDIGYYMPVNAGYLNPRKQVMAQIIVASNQGCDVIRDVVTGIITGNDETQIHRIVTEKGKLIYAKKVLLATGVFTEIHNLLPNHVRIKFKAIPKTVTLAQVSDDDARRLKNMPTLLYFGKGGENWFEDYPKDVNGNIHLYFLPPIKYPDGKYYIKLGHTDNNLKDPLKKSEITEVAL